MPPTDVFGPIRSRWIGANIAFGFVIKATTSPWNRLFSCSFFDGGSCCLGEVEKVQGSLAELGKLVGIVSSGGRCSGLCRAVLAMT